MILFLTQEQYDALADARERLADMEAEGKPGMLIAQIFGGEMRVGLVSHEKAGKLQEAMGGPVGTCARSAEEAVAASKRRAQ